MTRTLMTRQTAIASADVSRLIGEWHAHLDTQVNMGELAATTAETYRVGMCKFLEWVQYHGSLSDALVRAWVTDLKTAYKPRSVAVWFAGVAHFCDWAESMGYLAANPTRGITVLKRGSWTTSHVREPLSDEEVLRLFSVIPTNTKQGRRDLAMIALMVYTGVRQIQVHRARFENLKTRGGHQVLYTQGKGHAEADEYVVIARPRLQEALRAYLADRGNKDGPLFCSLSKRSFGKAISVSAIRRKVKSYFRAAGIEDPNKTTHSLRHTAGTKGIRSGAAIRDVQKMLHHRDAKTTEIYLHDDERIRHPAEMLIEFGEVSDVDAARVRNGENT